MSNNRLKSRETLAERYSKLSAEKRGSIVALYKKAADNPDEEIESQLDSAAVAATLAPIIAAPVALGAMSLGTHILPELSEKHMHEIINSAGLKNRLNINIDKGEAPYFARNAFFKEVKDKSKPNIVGEIGTIGKNMFRPGVIAHEVGHANIHANKGLAGILQRNAYLPTSIASRLGLGALTYFGANKLTENDDSPIVGGLKGGLLASLANAGVLLPEFEASRRGISYLMRSSLPRKEKILNSLHLLPAFLTYLTALAGPGATAGALNGYRNKKKKEKEQNAI